ncbi:hypothetical protein AMTRI_Chr01g130160 [Amborella trichopoda]
MGSGIYRLKEHLAWVKGNVTGSRKMISLFWYANALLFNYASSDFYPQMVTSIAEAEPRVRGPMVMELVGLCLDVVVHDVDKHIAQFKDKSHRYLVNLLIGCPRGIVYHSDIDLSRKRHTGRLICAHLDKIDIGKLKRVKYCILKSKLITRFIYNHTYLHALMREHCMREIVKESTTKLATAFLTIQSILVNKAGLRSMIRSNEWHTDRATMSQLGRQVETTLLDRRFWARLRGLRLSDSDDKPTMGFLFFAKRRARKAIFDNNVWNEEILEIIAVRTLNQTYAASGCERNWSTFQWIHAPRQNRLKTQMLHNLVYVHYNLKLREKHIRRTPTDSTSINLDDVFWRDLVDEWVSLRTPLLDQDFLGAVADMDDIVNVAASNEGDMTMDMDDDYTQDEDDAQDDGIDGTMENNWEEPVIQECEGVQHDAVPDEHEDLMRLAWEEVQALRHRSYSTRER